MEKRLQYIAEDINALLDKTEIAVDTEADRELMTNTPIARAGGLGRVVYVKATKKSYQYNIDTGEWVALPTSGVEIDAEISSTSENPVQNKVISGALDKKQDKLTAGENITIQNNVISVDGKIAKYFTGTNIELYNKIASGEFKAGDFVWLDNVTKDTSITDITDTKLVDGKVLMQIVDGPRNYNNSQLFYNYIFENYYTVILYNVAFKDTVSSYGTANNHLKTAVGTERFSIYKTHFAMRANPNSKSKAARDFCWFISAFSINGSAPHNVRLDATDKIAENNEQAVTSGAVYTALQGKQATLTTDQLAVVNSGITSADKTQISTNTNNITGLQSDVTTITTKLNTVEEGAQVNTIKSISLNSTPLTPDANKNVEITIPEVNIDNKTITKDNNGKIQAVAITNGTDIINYEALKKAMTITIEE